MVKDFEKTNSQLTTIALLIEELSTNAEIHGRVNEIHSLTETIRNGGDGTVPKIIQGLEQNYRGDAGDDSQIQNRASRAMRKRVTPCKTTQEPLPGKRA